ncbi:MAG: OmpP1/FadL family transporter [Bacteroidales bacterium]
MKRIIILAFFYAVLSINLAMAGGYQVRLQNQRSSGIALIGTPFNLDASSIFYNPGALSMFEGKVSLSGGINVIFPYAAFQQDYSTQTYQNKDMPGFPFYFYGAIKILPKFTAGIGIYTPYGSSLKWPNQWIGKNLVQKIALSSVYIQPTLSYKITPNLGVGAGIIYAFGMFNIQRGLNYSPEAHVKLDGSTDNIGYNIGVWAKPHSKIKIGLNYRSKINMKVTDGDAKFYIPNSLYSLIPKENKFESEIPLPANLDLGVAYQINDKWLIAAEIDWVFWSSYKELTFKFEEAPELLNQIAPREYIDILIPRLGVEYKVLEMLTLRTGLYYDQTPTNSNFFTPETVSLNTLGTTYGISFKPINNLSIDFSYEQLYGFKSKKNYSPADFQGTYNTSVTSFGLGLSLKF